MPEYTFVHPDDGSVLHFDDKAKAFERAGQIADYFSCDIVICENGQPIEPIVEGTRIHTYIAFNAPVMEAFDYYWDEVDDES